MSENVSQLTKDLGKYLQQTASPQDSEYGDTASFKGTIDVRALGSGNSNQPLDSGMASPEAIKATIKAGELAPGANQPRPAQEPEPVVSQENRTQLSSREKLAEQKRRLEYVCQLFERHRRPVCALNGLIVTVVNRLVEEFAGQLARQAKSDLETISRTTGVVCTATAIITGFESDEGCREFVMRLKEIHGESFLGRRFGKSYRSWESPTTKHLKEISNDSIENFDQYIYSIFTQHDALSSRHVKGNRVMVRFLCWVYARFFEGLETTLTNGFNVESNPDFPRFAGCYFMGVGENGQTGFFGEGIFERVEENQGELEWSQRILQQEESWSLASQLVFLLGIISLIAAGFLLLRNIWESQAASNHSPQLTKVECFEFAEHDSQLASTFKREKRDSV